MVDARHEEAPTAGRSGYVGSAEPRGPSDGVRAVQAFAALLGGILLLAVPLYLSKRPHAPEPPAPVERAADPPAIVVAPAPSLEAGRTALRVGDARVLECHDRGAKKTAPEECDHVVAFETALADAITTSQECAPSDAGSGSIEFRADLSFVRRRHPVLLSAPHADQSHWDRRRVKACIAAVRGRLDAMSLASLPHAHARYKIALATSFGP